MKKVLFFLPVFLLTLVSCDDFGEKSIPYAQLPSAARQTLRGVLDSTNVFAVTKELEIGCKYEVVYSDATEVTFDHHGNLLEVKTTLTNVPDALIPNEILTHANEYFTSKPNIKELEVNRVLHFYELTLDNGIEMYYDWNKNFIRLKN